MVNDDPNTPEDESAMPLFQITSIGRGMADALSNPRITAWPELDVCFTTLTSDDDFARMIGLLALQLILVLYMTQVFYIDVPLGTTTINATAASAMTPIQMKSLIRIPFTWTDNALATPRVGKPYSDGVSANGTPVPTYSVTSGSLPPGLTLNPTTGAITGTPKRRGTFTFTIAATNSAGSMSHSFTLSNIQNRPTMRATRDELLVSFAGRVSTNFKGKKVALQVFKYGKWVTIERVLVSKKGRFTASTFTQWVKRYRVVAGSSRSLVVTK